MLLAITVGAIIWFVLLLLYGQLFIFFRWSKEKLILKVRYFYLPLYPFPFGKKKGKEEEENEEEAEEEETEKKGKGRFHWPSLITAAPELVGTLLKSLRFLFGHGELDLSLQGKLGGEDPAQVGQLLGLLEAVRGTLTGFGILVKNEVTPHFLEEKTDLKLRGEVKIRLGYLLAVIPLALHYLPKRKLWRAWRRG